MSAHTYDDLEEILGVKFANRDLLGVALRHSSATLPECRGDSYEDLEFYGDKIIGYVLGGILRERMAGANRSERRMTQAFGRLSSREALGELGEELRLFSFIELGERVRDGMTPEVRHAIVADVYEAIVAAIHEDQGAIAAREFIVRTLVPKIQEVLAEPNLEDPKNQLWRYLQRRSTKPPTYELLERLAPQEPKRYICAVYHEGRLLAKGEGRTQKLGELDAAAKALRRMREQTCSGP